MRDVIEVFDRAENYLSGAAALPYFHLKAFFHHLGLVWKYEYIHVRM